MTVRRPDPLAATRAVYEAGAAAWERRRQRPPVGGAEALARRAAASSGRRRPILDAGCGPGWTSAALASADAPVVALDLAAAMLDRCARHHPAALRVQADLRALPLARGSLGGAWAARSYVHLPRRALPLALADLHRCLAVGAPAELVLFSGDQEHGPLPDDDFPGRDFSLWPAPMLADVLTGAGFTIDHLDVGGRHGHLTAQVTRARTLADTVGPGMRLLVCGLNPSLYAADAGVGYARPGNRFWPAALAAGLVSADRDPLAALRQHGVGMTDLVKRATRSADELTAAEHRLGLARVARLVAWLQPAAVCMVGLAGWRAAVDRGAVAGPQPRSLGGRPVYLLPSTSGLNAHSDLPTLTEHLRAAARLADG